MRTRARHSSSTVLALVCTALTVAAASACSDGGGDGPSAATDASGPEDAAADTRRGDALAETETSTGTDAGEPDGGSALDGGADTRPDGSGPDAQTEQTCDRVDSAVTFGTDARDQVQALALRPEGGIVVAGYEGEVPLQTPKSGFVAGYDDQGNRDFHTPLSTSSEDVAYAVESTSTGEFLVAGDSSGDLGGETNHGASDGFVAYYDSPDNRRWVKLIGGGEDDGIYSVVPGPRVGDGFVGGWSDGGIDGEESAGGTDGLVARLEAKSGEVDWATMIGSSEDDEVVDVEVVDDAVYAVGWTEGDLRGHSNAGKEAKQDAFVAELDPADGTIRDTWFAATPKNDRFDHVTAGPSGAIAAVGASQGDVADQKNAGPNCKRVGGEEVCLPTWDALTARYDTSSGSLDWARLEGETDSGLDEALSADFDGSGGLVSAGTTTAGFGGQSTTGGIDGFIVRYDDAGNRQSVCITGSSDDDAVLSVAVDGEVAWIGGWTKGQYRGQKHRGSRDSFIAKVGLD